MDVKHHFTKALTIIQNQVRRAQDTYTWTYNPSGTDPNIIGIATICISEESANNFAIADGLLPIYLRLESWEIDLYVRNRIVLENDIVLSLKVHTVSLWTLRNRKLFRDQ
uniref:Uncharacterized protein n=1 Tax=Romanomermis culicivorax TaxID=13658 RepID=A0A915KJR7_ROMCU